MKKMNASRTMIKKTFIKMMCDKEKVLEHIVHIDGVVGSSPTVTTENQDRLNGDPGFSLIVHLSSFAIFFEHLF